MNLNVAESPDLGADSGCGWPGSQPDDEHGGWAGVWADPDLFPPGRQAAAGSLRPADGAAELMHREAAPASGPGVVGAQGPDVTPGGGS